MKNERLISAVKFTLTGFALAGLSAYAQADGSNVTIYGYIDIGVQSVTGYGSGNVSPYSSERKTAMAEGYRNWLGFSGTEDLGGGVSATFNLQMRFQPGTGAFEEPGGTAFQGESTVGLSSTTVGALRLGRALTPYWAQKWVFDPWYDSEYLGSVGAYQNGSYNSDPTFSMGYANWGRMQNSIFYDSADLSGFKIHAATQVGTPVCSATPTVPCAESATGKVQSLTLTYNKGSFASMLAYEKNTVGDTIAMLGASYNMGAFTMMGTYGVVKLDTLYNPVSYNEKDFTLAATYATSANNTLRFGYGNDSKIAGAGAGGNGGAPLGTTQTKLAFGDTYALSKRTNIYADVWREKIATVPTSTGFGVGVNHTF